MRSSRGMLIFQNDLRLHDNQALMRLAEAFDQLLCVFFIPSWWYETNQFDCRSLGHHREKFIFESLIALDTALRGLGNKLFIARGDQYDIFKQVTAEYQPDHIAMSESSGIYEQRFIQRVREHADSNDIKVTIDCSYTLFRRGDLPFELEEMPNVFSPFRRKIEQHCQPRELVKRPQCLPPPPHSVSNTQPAKSLDVSNSFNKDYPRLLGGEQAGIDQLSYYLDKSNLIQQYKTTRNGLDGWNFSSKLSAWLATGCVSSAGVAHAIFDYEKKVIKNDSTYWLYFELLWRVFFYWQHCKHRHNLYRFGGIQQKAPATKHDHLKFEQWRSGNTGYPIVDASMRQLNATGFMSNRARQLAASCFVHELSLDWRYGAAYFEQQLIDYDVASNWGNWQYLAGVGSDPRGHRRFNFAKQTEQYDPNGTFVSKWMQR